jgi:hypothetical protein
VIQLTAYDNSFADFFARLKSDGIDQNNSLFVITADEGDHCAGGPPTPATCDGVNVACTYPKIGEIDSNIADLLFKEDPSLAATLKDLQKAFSIHFDMAQNFYLRRQPA